MNEGVLALLSHSIRDAIYDIRPNPNKARVKPYMYWNPQKSKACVKMLLKRAPALKVLADKYPKGQFARMYAGYVRTNSNNERSMQKRQLRLIFTDPASDFSMIRISTAQGADPDIKISSALSMDFDSVQELRNAIASGSMYAHPALFDLFCAGLESGRFRSTMKLMNMAPIEELITVAHEAHFRLELWYSRRGLHYSRQDSLKQNIAERHDKFGEFCRYVIADRHDNATAAFKKRTAGGAPVVDDAASSSDEDDGVETDFW
jgi:hypothetical protein